MPLKYEMIWDDGKEMYRIKAVRSFSNKNFYMVKEGEFGGWVKSEDNLSHEGGCWIDKNSKLYGNSRVRGDALLRNSIMSGNSIADGNALIRDSVLSGDSYITDDVVFTNSHARDKASMSREVYLDSCILSGDAIVYGEFESVGAHITELTTRQPIVLDGLGDYPVTIMDNHINVSCITRTVEKWRKTKPDDAVFSLISAKNEDIERNFKILKPVLEQIVASREIDKKSNQF